MKICDFARACLRFHSDRIQNNARLEIDALCTITQIKSGMAKRYALTVPCLAENMYEERDLIQQPTAEFRMIASEQEYRMIKNYACAEKDTDIVRAVGETYHSFDGRRGRLTEVIIHAPYEPAREIATYRQFETAFFEHQTVVGISEYETPNGDTRVRLEYPCRTINIQRQSETWQIDAGPLLYAELTNPESISILALQRAFLVYHAFDWAEVAVHQPMTCFEDEKRAATAAAYGQPRRVSIRNRLFTPEPS